MAKSKKIRKLAHKSGYHFQRKIKNKWEYVDKYGEATDTPFYARNEYLAQVQLEYLERSYNIREEDSKPEDTELPTDEAGSTEVSE